MILARAHLKKIAHPYVWQMPPKEISTTAVYSQAYRSSHHTRQDELCHLISFTFVKKQKLQRLGAAIDADFVVAFRQSHVDLSQTNRRDWPVLQSCFSTVYTLSLGSSLVQKFVFYYLPSIKINQIL